MRFEVLSRDINRVQGDFDQLGEQLTVKDAGQGKALQALRQELGQASGDLRSEYKGAELLIHSDPGNGLRAND